VNVQLFTDPNAGGSIPDQPTGWEAPAGSETSFTVGDDWKAGRIWGRTECDFFNPNGATACVTGSCNGGLECDRTTGTGVPPVSLAEWTLSGDGNRDFYDGWFGLYSMNFTLTLRSLVSLVDGFNLPMTIDPTADCAEASCPVDLNAECPPELAGPSGSNGNAGCKSACLANLDGNQRKCHVLLYDIILIILQRTLPTAAPEATALRKLALPVEFSSTITSRIVALMHMPMLMMSLRARLSGPATPVSSRATPSLSVPEEVEEWSLFWAGLQIERYT
jgi:hypothetical protein